MKIIFKFTMFLITETELLKIKNLLESSGIEIGKLEIIDDFNICINNIFFIDQEMIIKKVLSNSVEEFPLANFSDREFFIFIQKAIFELIKLNYNRNSVIRIKFRKYFLNERIIK